MKYLPRESTRRILESEDEVVRWKRPVRLRLVDLVMSKVKASAF